MNRLLHNDPSGSVSGTAPAEPGASCGCQSPAIAASEPSAPHPIAAHHFVGDVTRRHPETINTLVAMGFAPARFGALRRTILKRVTLAHAAAQARVPLAHMLRALNAQIGAPDAPAPMFGACCGRGQCPCEARQADAAAVDRRCEAMP